ncbi:MAG: DUF488 domain-containing protein [Deltaproteobacteria bacterium]|nr:DUF488 domain-containing protein [Deltaproteobacteria bacterium]
MRILTIGGYGFTEDKFIHTLKSADVDILVDIRQRRGLRGSRYAFLNSKRLQAILNSANIRYLYVRELAPTSEIRETQKREDANSKTSKRDRLHLSPNFVSKYQNAILSTFDFTNFQHSLISAQAIAFFCVEGAPEACHRSLAAEHIASLFDENIQVEHLIP